MPSSAIFFLELGLVILGLSVLARVALRFGLSPIPLYLIAGLAFGEGGVVPLVTARGFIETAAELGVIMLLLLLGLEYPSDELARSLRSSWAAGLFDFIVNYTPGLAAGLLLGWDPVAALLLGGVTYLSSSGIVAKLLDDLGWTANRETPTVLSILVFEDLAMVFYLPLMAALLVNRPAFTTAVSVALALSVMVLTLIGAIKFGPRISSLVFTRSDEVLLLTILGVTLIVAGIAERFDASAAIGAFLVGIGLSGRAADSARSLVRPVRDLFGAVFFFFFGLEVHPANVPSVIGVAATLAAFSIAGKYVTGWASARRAGGGRFARRRAGAVLIAHGEFSIVIAGIGAVAGIERRLLPVTAVYVLLLAVAGPLAAKAVDMQIARQRAARRRQPGVTTP